jgi:hypothetical protein
MSLLGDPGAGKTRTVAEALNDKGTRDRVLFDQAYELGELRDRSRRDRVDRRVFEVTRQ